MRRTGLIESVATNANDIPSTKRNASSESGGGFPWIFSGLAALIGVTSYFKRDQLDAVISTHAGAAVGSASRRYLDGLAPKQKSDSFPAELQDQLVEATRELGVPAQAVLAAQWNGLTQKAIHGVENAAALRGRPVGELSPDQRLDVYRTAARAAVGPARNWIPGRALVLSTVVPASILFIASRMRSLTPFSFITGTVATVFAAPLLYRLASRVRVWSTSENDKVRQASKDTLFQQALSKVGLDGSMQPDLFHNGRWYRGQGMDEMDRFVDAAAQVEDLETGCRQLALGIVNHQLAYPEVPIDTVWSMYLSERVGARYGNAECRRRISEFLKPWAVHFEVDPSILETHLTQMLSPPPGTLFDVGTPLSTNSPLQAAKVEA
jgi:hypothetical protein